ncbi:MAG: extracellular solute-binding protein, partial [Actinobacteria bacterium]|nr:extracellular solute-binding protein [Actinomycetota bacterium]MSY05506.1 extracellular solute-binding protein [Actinomycetota bacterium]
PAADTPVTVTIWHNLGDTQNATATKALTDAYTAAHPNVTFDLVSQPGDNYFSLLQAAAVSKTGPDLVLMWTGLFALKYKEYLTSLKGLVPDDALASQGSLEWSSDNFDIANGPYVMPLDRQFYIGFYNKDAFAKAGVTAVPTTWTELYESCAKLKKAGYTPIVYGNGGQSLGALYYPWYDGSYLAIGQNGGDGKSLYNGSNAWDSAENVATFSKYAALKSKGCTNSDILTKTNNVEDFIGEKAAMIIDGTWDTKKFTDALGDKVSAFVPPFSDNPIKGVVEFAGQGFALTSYAAQKQAAVDFLTFMTTDEAAKVIDAAGLIPNKKGSTTSNPVNQEMLAFAASGGFTTFPMLDNVLQGDVVDAGNKIIPSILAGKTSPAKGLAQLKQVWDQIPAENKGDSYK